MIRSMIAPLVLGCLLIPHSARAARLDLSLHGGLSVASVEGRTPAIDPSSKLGPSGVASLDVPIGSLFFVRPELGYAARGFSYGEGTVVDYNGNAHGKFESLLATDVLTVGAPLHLVAPLPGPVRLGALAGPAVGFLVRQRFVTTGASQSETKIDFFRHTDFDLVLGATADVAAGPGRWGVEGRYVHGLNQLSEPGVFSTHTRAFEVMTDYSNALGH